MIKSSQSLILLLLITTSVCMDAEWSVTYGPAQHICALEGSSIIMQCTYTYPLDLKVKDVQWVNQDMEDPVDFSTDADYSDRFTTDCEDKRCSLLLTNVSVTDALQRYQCKIITDRETESYIGEPGISLSVTNLEIVSSKEGELQDGDFVSLTCHTTCNLPDDPLVIWSKDGHLLEEKKDNQLILGPISDYHSGTYTCAFKGYEYFPSPSVVLRRVLSEGGGGNSTAASGGGWIITAVIVVLMATLGGLRIYHCTRCIQNLDGTEPICS